MNYLNEFSYHLSIIISLFILFSLYKLLFKRKHNNNNFRHSQLKPVPYWRFLLAFYKSNFDIYKILSHLSDDAKDEGIFTIDLIFKRWIFVFRPQYIQKLFLDTENIDRISGSLAHKGIAEHSLFCINGNKWRSRRTFLNPAFRKNILELYIPKILKHSQDLIDFLKEKNNEYLDSYSLLIKYIFETICDIFFDLDDESMRRKSFDEVLKLKNYITNICFERIFNIFLWPDFIFRLTKKGKLYEKSTFLIRDSVRKVFVEKFKLSNAVMDNEENIMHLKFIDLYRNALEKKIPDLTIETMIDDILMITEAGSETTANQLSWILYEIGKNIHIQNNIQKELDEIITSDDCNLTMEDLNKLRYLECVIKESLRIHPSVPIVERYSKKEHLFGNRVFSKNLNYYILLFKLHQNPDLFPNPDIFDPNRFLPENSANIPPFSYLPFSAGTRMCIGNYYAILQMKIFLAKILKLYNIESLPEKCHYIIKAMFLMSKEPRQIKLTPRNCLK